MVRDNHTTTTIQTPKQAMHILKHADMVLVAHALLFQLYLLILCSSFSNAAYSEALNIYETATSSFSLLREVFSSQL